MTTEGLQNLKADDEEIEIVQDFLLFGSIINQKADWLQVIRRRLRPEGTRKDP